MLKPIMTLAAVCAVSLMAGCSNQAEEPVVPTYKTGLKASERNSSEFGKVFPQQYNSYLKNSEDGLDTEPGSRPLSTSAKTTTRTSRRPASPTPLSRI